MKNLVPFLMLFVLLSGCKTENESKKKTIVEAPKELEAEVHKTNVQFAEGFKVKQYEGYKKLTLKNLWPGSDKEFNFILVKDADNFKSKKKFDGIIEVPLKSIVVTSTTHIPSLEMLGVEDRLVGFPNLDYISSEKTIQRIDAGEIMELGKNEDLNTELLVELQPDLMVTFAIDSDNSSAERIQEIGIPVLYNGDWNETTPLGKAEWIKFFGVLMGKEKTADSIFNRIKIDYTNAKNVAGQSESKPTVLSGAMYRDLWHLPQGGSWAAQLIADANGEYLWNDTEGTGSSSLNVESVLEKGKNAQYWIGPGQFTSLDQMKEAHSAYEQFDAYQNNNVYSFTNKKGANGGVLYYELAPNRPDMVLKDIGKILHPELFPDHELYFFTKIE
ncbi:MAG: ABC transporter substrate-binding protein [Marinirhabdus sp.]|nr:ABC transporter substrate-binding protein [Marinirhabdus sp.]